MPSKSSIEKSLGPVFLKLCKVVEQPEGILVKCEKCENDEEFQRLYKKIVSMGGEYLLGKRQFLFPQPVKPSADSIIARARTVQMLPIDALVPSSFAIREPGSTKEMMTVKTHGVLEPLIVRPLKNGKYEVAIGNRRLRNAENSGIRELLCIILEMTDQECMELQFVENKDREALTDYEVGRWLKEMMQRYPETYPNQKVLENRTGINQAYISQLITHFEGVEAQKEVLPPEIIAQAIKLPERVTREIRKAPEELRPSVTKTAIKEELSARETAKVIEALTMPNVTLNEAITAVQEDTRKRVEVEEKRQKALLEKLKKCYPAELVDYVAKRDGVTTEGSMFKACVEIVSEMWRKLRELGLTDQTLKKFCEKEK